MSDFATAWNLCRQRFLDEIKDLRADQLNWRIHPESLSIGQMAIHVAGVETLFASQLAGKELSADEARLKTAATEGVVNDQSFPFSDGEIGPDLVGSSLASSRAMLEPLITSPSPAVLTKEIKSALGPIITGEGAFARMAFHSAYHQGQAYLIKTAPGFPS